MLSSSGGIFPPAGELGLEYLRWTVHPLISSSVCFSVDQSVGRYVGPSVDVQLTDHFAMYANDY